MRLGFRVLVGLLVVAAAAPVVAQNNYPLEITWPKAVGAAPNGIDTNAAVRYAYPGLLYEHRVQARGGCFPYSYSLNNGPGWLTIDSSTGIMTGTPTDESAHDDASITVTVTETTNSIPGCDGSSTSQTFGIDVTTANTFFVDKVNGRSRIGNGGCSSSCGTGTLQNPWRDLEDVFDGTTTTSQRVYFRGSPAMPSCGGANAWTYTTANIPVVNADSALGEERIEWDNRSTIWMRYPGELPRIDFGYTGPGYPFNDGTSVPRILWDTTTGFLDGFQVTRVMTVGWALARDSGRGVGVTRNQFCSGGPGIDGGNSAYVLWGRASSQMTYGDFVDGNLCQGIAQSGTDHSYSCFKFYDVDRTVIQRNTASGGTGDTEAMFALKGGVTKVTVRQNVFTDIGVNEIAIGGNMANSDSPLFVEFSGEICFNLVLTTVSTTFGTGALRIIEHSDDFEEVSVYRNTFVGLVSLNQIGTEDGPLVIRNNIIVNNSGAQTPWPYIFENAITDQSRVIYSTDPAAAAGNLVGTPVAGIVDVNGNLTAAYEGYLGIHGHQLIAGPPLPQKVNNLRLTPN
jgi:hypothetical protein